MFLSSERASPFCNRCYNVLTPHRKGIFTSVKRNSIDTCDRPERLLSYWKADIWVCVAITISGIVCNFGQLAFPYFEGALIDEVENRSPYSSVWELSLAFVAAILVFQLFRAIKRYTIRVFANDTKARIRFTLFNNLMQESEEDLSKENVGTLLSRNFSDTQEAVEGMRKLTTEIFDTVVLFVFYLTYLFFFDTTMTLYALIPVFVSVVFAFLMRKKVYRLSYETRKVNSKMSSETYDLFEHALLYRTYGRDGDNLKAYDKTLAEYEKYNVRNNLLSHTIIPFVNLIALVGIIPVIYLGTGHVANGDSLSFAVPGLMNPVWTDGQFTTYITTFVLLCSKASHTARLFTSIEKGLSGWKRIAPYIRPYHPYARAEKLEKNDEVNLTDFSIVLNNGTLIRDLNVSVRKGEILGVTGPIASGKSVLGKVFLKQIPYLGKAELFGKEVKDLSEGEIKGNVTYMGHTNQLLTDTLENNISYGEKKDVKPYLSAVDFDKDMKEMPLKEKTVVGNEGLKLSGGQQERLCLARSLYHAKGLLVLDDPFASVDMKTEKKILKNVAPYVKDSAVLLISHRLSSFPSLDRILVLHGDGTFALGKHEELLKSDGTYRQLVLLQEENAKHEEK